MKRRTAVALAALAASLLVAAAATVTAHANGDSTKQPTPPAVRSTITGW